MKATAVTGEEGIEQSHHLLSCLSASVRCFLPFKATAMFCFLLKGSYKEFCIWTTPVI